MRDDLSNETYAAITESKVDCRQCAHHSIVRFANPPNWVVCDKHRRASVIIRMDPRRCGPAGRHFEKPARAA